MRNKILILAVGAFLAFGTAFTGFLVINKPSTVAVKSVSNLVEDVFEREEFGLVLDTLSKGSMEFSLDSVTDADGEELLQDSHFHGKLYTSKDAIMLTDVEVQVYGQRFAGELYASKDELYVREDEFIGGSYFE